MSLRVERLEGSDFGIEKWVWGVCGLASLGVEEGVLGGFYGLLGEPGASARRLMWAGM
jgi:hypothetical protein